MQRFDVAVIGAGAAGMMCAAVAAQRGRSVFCANGQDAEIGSERPTRRMDWQAAGGFS